MPTPFVDPLVRLRRRSFAALLVILLLAAAALLFAPAAQARWLGEGRFVRGVGAETSRGLWLGAIEAPANGDARYPTWCTHMWRDDPEPHQTASLSTLDEAAQWGPEELDVTTAQMAWILLTHQENPDATNRAALAYLVHANFEAADAGREPAESVARLISVVRAQAPDIDELARQYVREARASAAVAYEKGEASGEGSRRGTLSSIGVRSTSGWVAGRAVTASLTGPAVFEETGTATWTGRTGDEGITLPWRATGNGEVTALLVYEEPSRSTLTKYTTGPRLQDTLSIGDRPAGEAVERRVDGPTWRVAVDFRVRASSDVGEAKILDEGPISDRVRVEADPDYGSGAWLHVDGRPVPVVFTGTAYRVGTRPPAVSADVPEGAEPLGTATFTATGPGDYTASLDIDAEPGFITWVWRAERGAQGSVDEAGAPVPVSTLLASDWSDAFGLADETSSLRGRISIDTALSTRTTKSGVYLVDDLFVTGFPSDHPDFAGAAGFEADVATIVQSLLFFPEGLAVVEENRGRAEVIGRVEIPASNGFHSSVGATDFRIDERPGTYVFISEFPGDARVRPFVSSVEDVSEQYRVPPAPTPDTPQSAPPAADTPQSAPAPPSPNSPQSAPAAESPQAPTPTRPAEGPGVELAKTGASHAPLLLGALLALAGALLLGSVKLGTPATRR